MGWKDLENEMSGVLTEEFAEPVNHVPMARPDVNGRWEADPTRPRQMFDAVTQRPVGIFEWLAHEEFIGKGQDKTRAVPAATHSTRIPMLYVDVRDFDAAIQVGDGIAIVEEGLAFRVVDPKPDGQGRLAVQLEQIGARALD